MIPDLDLTTFSPNVSLFKRNIQIPLLVALFTLLNVAVFYYAYNMPAVVQMSSLSNATAGPVVEGVRNAVVAANGDVIQYVYFETEDAKANLQFFLRHALHDKADFIFVLNGPCTVAIPEKENIKVVHRNNTCFDLGSHGEVVNNLNLSSKYSRIILMNASLRGPFIPRWSPSCWSDLFLDKLDDQVKLVGTTPNCARGPHLQSMLLAFDSTSLNIVKPSLQCFATLEDAIINGELKLTQRVRDAGYKAVPIMTRPFSWDRCTTDYDPINDLVFPGNYGTRGQRLHTGLTIHPFDMIFMKTKRFPTDDPVISYYSEWMDGYSSYNACKRK